MNDLPHDPRTFHVPAGPPPDPPESEPFAAPRPRRRRRRWGRRALVVALVMAVVPLYFAISAWRTWSGVERIELSDVTRGAATGTNYLVVGTDSREGVDADVENAGVIFGAEGGRTDTIAVLHVDGDAVRLLAIPRDLWVDVEGTSSRINAVLARGDAELLVRTVQDVLGIGIDHYLEIDMAGFLSLVAALGGVTLDFPNPAFDTKSGLSITEAGPQRLDSAAALAYVRSRSYTEIVNGVEQRDPRADLGRVERQQRFLAAVFSKLGTTRNPFTLLDALDDIAANVRVDDDLGFTTVLSLGLAMRGTDPATATLPTTRFITDGGADVLLLDVSEAAPILRGLA